MTIAIPSVSTSTDSFLIWITNSNKAFSALSNYAITTNSNTTVGNAAITGTFTSNALFSNVSLKIGYSTQNVVMSNSNMIVNSTATLNSIYSQDGLIINYPGGSTRYTGALISIPGAAGVFTNVNSTNVISTNAFFSNNIVVGNTIITRSNLTVDTLTVKNSYNPTIFNVGDAEGNVYIDRYGLKVNYRPAGQTSAFSNVFIQGTQITTPKIYSGICYSNSYFIADGKGGYVTAFTLSTTTTTTTPVSGPPVTVTNNMVKYESNNFFTSQNNFFSFGLTSNGNVGITSGLGEFKAKTPLHIAKQFTTTTKALNNDSVVVVESNLANTFIEFKHAPASGSVGSRSGLIFTDNSQTGHLVYNTVDRYMKIGAYSGITFEVGGNDIAGPGIAVKPTIMEITPTYVSLDKGAPLRLNGASGYTELVSNTSPDTNIRFILPGSDGSANQVMISVDGTGTLGWSTVPSLMNGSDLSVSTLTTTLNATIGTNLKVSGSLGVGTDAGGAVGEIRATDDITAFYSSDISLKTNIKNIDNAMDKIQKINGVTFDWTDSHLIEHGGEDDYFNRKHDVGVIAQEIEAVLPEVVATRENGIKAVKYDRIVALLIEGIKELKTELDEMKKNSCSCGCK